MIKKIVLTLVLVTGLFSNDMFKSYIDNLGKMNYNRDTMGLMRNIKVYKNPSWVSKITLKNGKKYFFCSPKSLIEFYNNPGLRPDLKIKDENDFEEILVTDFNTLKPLDAKGAFYVYGSNKISAAGDDLPAFSTYAEAEHFSKTHNGKRVMSFYQIPAGLIALLNGKI